MTLLAFNSFLGRRTSVVWNRQSSRKEHSTTPFQGCFRALLHLVDGYCTSVVSETKQGHHSTIFNGYVLGDPPKWTNFRWIIGEDWTWSFASKKLWCRFELRPCNQKTTIGSDVMLCAIDGGSIAMWMCTLSPIIMEVENYPIWKETNIGDTPIFHHFSLNHDYGRKGY